MTTEIYCRNCAVFLSEQPGKFCRSCGQETNLHPPTVGEFAHEFVGHYVALEGKLWKTLQLLFFKPAELSREYLAGRRRRYVLPLRLYLTASLLFFFLVKFAGLGSKLNVQINPQNANLQIIEEMAAADGCDKSGSSQCEVLRRLIEQKRITQPSAMKPRIGLDPNAHAEDMLNCDRAPAGCGKVKQYLTEKYKGLTVRQMGESVKQRMVSAFPYLMFCLLPVFALFTKIIYWRRKLFYGEHLVYALHIHAFAFFMMLLISFAPNIVDEILIVLMLAYFYVGMQRFFGGRWWANGLRYVSIGFAYPLAMAVVALTSLLVSIFL